MESITYMDQLELIHKNLRPLRIDALPAEVATEYLTTPGFRMTGTFRRTCDHARASYFVSTNEPKAVALKLAHRFSRLPIDRLLRQLRRTEQRIKIAQGRISRITIEHYKAQVVNNIMLPLLAAGKAIVAEIRRREDKIQTMKAIADA